MTATATCTACNDTGRDGIFRCEPCNGGTISDPARIARRAARKARLDGEYMEQGAALALTVALHGYEDDAEDI